MTNFWPRCLSHLQRIVPSEQYKTWIEPLKVELKNNSLSIEAPNRFALDLLRDKYIGEIQTLAKNLLDSDVKIITTLSAHKSAITTIPSNNDVNKKDIKTKQNFHAQPKSTNRINKLFTFDSFVTGKANQLARAAGLQVGDNPGGAEFPQIERELKSGNWNCVGLTTCAVE